MFDDKVEKILTTVRNSVTNQTSTITLFQRILTCNAEEKTRAVRETMALLTRHFSTHAPLYLDLRENDLSIANLESLAEYTGVCVAVDVSSNYLVIRSEADEQLWTSIMHNPCLNVTPGWHQPIYDMQTSFPRPSGSSDTEPHK